MPQESCKQYADKILDLGELREELEATLDYTMVESEGPDVLRIDVGGSSVWVNENGETTGQMSGDGASSGMSKHAMSIIKAAITKCTKG